MSRPGKAEKPRSKSQSSKVEQARVVKLPPTAPAARDEGPRLIPLPVESKQSLDPPRVKHYLDLAEKALRAKDPKDSKE